MSRGMKEHSPQRKAMIVPYAPCYQPVFRALNEAWITEHWAMEETDYHALDHPQEHILDAGGAIYVALFGGEPVGVCALLRSCDPAYDYELSKLAVSPSVRGGGIGRMLCLAVLARAREQGAATVYLDSNTRLDNAIRLYRSLGFAEVERFHSIYGRANIRMALRLAP